MVHILFFIHGIWLIIHTFLMHLLKMEKVTIETRISLIAAILYKKNSFSPRVGFIADLAILVEHSSIFRTLKRSQY